MRPLHIKFVVKHGSIFLTSPTAKGSARGFFVFLREDYANDKKTYEHELVHVRQYWKSFGLHGLLYKFSKKYQMNAECEAFARAEFLTHQYVTMDWCRKMARVGLGSYPFFSKTTYLERLDCLVKWKDKLMKRGY